MASNLMFTILFRCILFTAVGNNWTTEEPIIYDLSNLNLWKCISDENRLTIIALNVSYKDIE